MSNNGSAAVIRWFEGGEVEIFRIIWKEELEGAVLVSRMAFAISNQKRDVAPQRSDTALEAQIAARLRETEGECWSDLGVLAKSWYQKGSVFLTES